MKVRTTKGVNIVLQHPKLGSGKIKRKGFFMYRGHTHQDNPNSSKPKKKRKPKEDKEGKTPITLLAATEKQIKVIGRVWHMVKTKPIKEYFNKATVQFVKQTKGSGNSKKVTERYFYSILRNMENSYERAAGNIPVLQSKPPPRKTNPLKFPDESVKITFLYWQRLSYPFMQHKQVMSKVTSRGINYIDKATKKHGKDEVMKAMKRLHDAFNAGWFKYRAHFSETKLALPDFFLYKESHYQKISRIPSLTFPRSWFREALKGQHYLESKYGVELKDRKPRITSHLLESWDRYIANNGNSTHISNGVKNTIIRSARILSKFSTANNIDPLTLTDVIEGALNKWHTIKPKHAGYLTNKIFWNEQLPNELVRYGAIEAGRKIERVL